MCIDVTMVEHIQACHSLRGDIPGFALCIPTSMYICATSVWSNHCFQTIGIYRPYKLPKFYVQVSYKLKINISLVSLI